MLLYNKSYNLFDIQNIFAIDNYCAKISEVACQNVESKAWSSWRIKSVLLKVNWKIAKSPPHPALAEYVLVCQDCFYFFLSIAYEWCILTWPWVIDKKKALLWALNELWLPEISLIFYLFYIILLDDVDSGNDTPVCFPAT